jgi:DNA-binding beta-propeller fold protein YncE
MNPQRRYDVFFSYTHADAKLAEKLRRGLEGLGRPIWRLHPALRVFRDAEDMPPSPRLREVVYAAIADSEWFLLLATPASARSDFVRDEVWQFLATHPPERLLIATTVNPKTLWDREANAIAAGAPFHRELHRIFREEPSVADLSWADPDERGAELSIANPRFADKVAFLQAPLRGLTKDALIGAELARRQRVRKIRSGVGALLVVLAAAASVAAIRATAAQHLAEEQERIAETGRLAAQSQLLAEADPSLSALLAVEAHDLGPEQPPAGRRLAEAALSSLVARRPVPGQGPAVQAAFADGGASIAVFGERSGGSGAAAQVEVTDGRTGEVLLDAPVPDGMFTVTPDGAFAVVASREKVQHVDLESGSTTAVPLDQPFRRTELVASPSSRYVGGRDIAHLIDGTVRVWDATTGELVVSLPAPNDLTQLTVSDRGDVAVAGAGGQLRVVGPDGQQRWTTSVGFDPVALAFDHRTSVLAVGTSSGVRLYDMATGDALDGIPEGDAVGTKIAFTGDDAVMAVASDGSLGRWETRRLAGVGLPIAIGEEVDGIAFGATPDDIVITTVAHEATVLSFAPHDGLGDLLPPSNGPSGVAFTPDGSTIVRHDGRRLLVVEDGQQREIVGGPVGPTGAAISPDGRTVVVTGRGGGLGIYHLDDDSTRLLSVGRAGTTGMRGAVFSADGRRVAVTAQVQLNSGVAVVDVVDEEVLWSLEPSVHLALAALGGMTWAPDGKLALVQASPDTSVALVRYDPDTGDERGRIDLSRGSTNLASAVVFADGRLFVGMTNGEVRVHDPDSGKLLRRLSPPAGFGIVGSMVHDGRRDRVVAADLHGQIAGWSTTGPDPIFGPVRVQQPLPISPMTWMALAPDGRRLITGDPSGGVRGLPWGETAWRAAACRAAGRNLTDDEWSTYLPRHDSHDPTCPDAAPR